MCSDWSAAQKALRCESGKGFKSLSFAYSVSGTLDFPTVDWEYFQDGPHNRSSIYTWLSMQPAIPHQSQHTAGKTTQATSSAYSDLLKSQIFSPTT